MLTIALQLYEKRSITGFDGNQEQFWPGYFDENKSKHKFKLTQGIVANAEKKLT